jgi:hypothetical protein
MTGILPLAVHPLPYFGEKLSKWFERLAIANFIEFDIFLKYVASVAKSTLFEITVKKLTKIQPVG